jgi:hypothetical protein
VRERNIMTKQEPAWTAEPWLALWTCGAIWMQASLEGIACFYGLRSVRSSPCVDSLAALGRAMERQMRTPAFLGLVPFGLRMLSPRALDFDSVVRMLVYLFPSRPSEGDPSHD